MPITSRFDNGHSVSALSTCMYVYKPSERNPFMVQVASLRMSQHSLTYLQCITPRNINKNLPKLSKIQSNSIFKFFRDISLATF